MPVVYLIKDGLEPALRITWHDGAQQVVPELTLTPEASSELFRRSGRIRQLTVILTKEQLFAE